MKNRRNYYRLLQVQPDAPPEIIRTSYRTLMRELKQHPDLGGEHSNASILNEAYETLRDRKKRAEYDRQLLQQYTKEAIRPNISGRKPLTGISCPLCGKQSVRQLPAGHGCPACAGFMPAGAEKQMHRDLQRTVHRMKKRGRLQYRVSRFQPGKDAAMLDLSPAGVRFLCPEELKGNTTVMIESPLFRARARVVHAVKHVMNGRSFYHIGAEFQRVAFNSARGSFYSGSV